jgi:hypothetical protein
MEMFRLWLSITRTHAADSVRIAERLDIAAGMIPSH